MDSNLCILAFWSLRSDSGEKTDIDFRWSEAGSNSWLLKEGFCLWWMLKKIWHNFRCYRKARGGLELVASVFVVVSLVVRKLLSW